MGIGLGNLDGWDGDYSVHLLPAGPHLSVLNFNKNILLRLFFANMLLVYGLELQSSYHDFLLSLFISFPLAGWKSSTDACFS